MHNPLADQEHGAFREMIATHIKCFYGVAAYSPSRRIKAHRFVDHPFCVGQIGQIAERRSFSCQHRLQFSKQSFAGIWILRKQVKSPC